jgi:hypothetical protein
MEKLPTNPEKDKDLEAIRHYKGTWKNFFDFWKKRGVSSDPYKGTLLKHPEEKEQKESELPYQDFGTYKKSLKNKLVESFENFLKGSL